MPLPVFQIVPVVRMAGRICPHLLVLDPTMLAATSRWCLLDILSDVQGGFGEVENLA